MMILSWAFYSPDKLHLTADNIKQQFLHDKWMHFHVRNAEF